VGTAELLQRLQEPAVELRGPAPPCLPAGRLRRQLSLLVVAAFGAAALIVLGRVGVGIGGAGPVAAVPDHGRVRRGGQRQLQLQLGALLLLLVLLLLLLLERLERAPVLPAGVERHRPARQQQQLILVLRRGRGGLLLVTPELHGLQPVRHRLLRLWMWQPPAAAGCCRLQISQRLVVLVGIDDVVGRGGGSAAVFKVVGAVVIVLGLGLGGGGREGCGLERHELLQYGAAVVAHRLLAADDDAVHVTPHPLDSCAHHVYKLLLYGLWNDDGQTTTQQKKLDLARAVGYVPYLVDERESGHSLCVTRSRQRGSSRWNTWILRRSSSSASR
jgi:hypothetical protein